MSQSKFLFEMNEDAMASDKLADGIRRFAADARLLEAMIDDELKGN